MAPILVENYETDPLSNDPTDELTSQLETLYLGTNNSEDVEAVTDALEKIIIKDLDVSCRENLSLKQCHSQSTKNEHVDEEAKAGYESEPKSDEDKPATTLNSFEKSFSKDAISFKPNFDDEDEYSSDENNETCQESDENNNNGSDHQSTTGQDFEKASNEDVDDKTEASSSKNSPQSNFIKRGVEEYAMINALSFGTQNHYQNDYSDSYQQHEMNMQSDFLNSPFNDSYDMHYAQNGNTTPEITGHDYAGFFNQDVDSALFGHDSLTGNSFGQMSSTFQSVPHMHNSNNDVNWHNYDLVDSWNQNNVSSDHSGSPGSDGMFHYQPPTPPKSVSPSHHNHDEKNESLIIDVLTTINKNSQSSHMIAHEEKLRYLRNALKPAVLAQDLDVSSIDPDEMDVYLRRNEDLDVSSIDPDEMDVYLRRNESTPFDSTKANQDLLKKCDPIVLEEINSLIAKRSNASVCKMDEQGDSALSIICSKEEDEHFYETLYGVTKRAKNIPICCDKPVGKSRKCKICNNSNPDKFYTPLSFMNKDGDTPLSILVTTWPGKKLISECVINFFLSELRDCNQDMRREFDPAGIEFYTNPTYLINYPIFEQLKKF